MFKSAIFTLSFICIITIRAQDTIKILFSYGSRPHAKGESRWFGGIHGGHVSISYYHQYASFVPNGDAHVFPKKKQASAFIIERDGQFIFDTTDSRYLILYIPADSQTIAKKDSILQCRLNKPGYDYALFGMRCASAAYEVMASAGLYPKYSRKKQVIKYFYPKLLRKKLLRQAKKNNWKMVYRPGRKTRKWEMD
jgi:hypothetical protein